MIFYLRQVRDDELLDQEVHLTLGINLVNSFIVHHTIFIEEHVMKPNLCGTNCKEIQGALIVQLVALKVDALQAAHFALEQQKAVIMEECALQVVFAAL